MRGFQNTESSLFQPFALLRSLYLPGLRLRGYPLAAVELGGGPQTCSRSLRTLLQYIEFRDMLPKSKVGKLLRREMRAEERKLHEKD